MNQTPNSSLVHKTLVVPVTQWLLCPAGDAGARFVLWETRRKAMVSGEALIMSAEPQEKMMMGKVCVAKRLLGFFSFFVCFFERKEVKDPFSDFQISQTPVIHTLGVKSLRWRNRCSDADSFHTSTVATRQTLQSEKRQFYNFLILLIDLFLNHFFGACSPVCEKKEAIFLSESPDCCSGSPQDGSMPCRCICTDLFFSLASFNDSCFGAFSPPHSPCLVNKDRASWWERETERERAR